MKEKKITPALFQLQVPQITLQKWGNLKNTWIQFENPKMRERDVIKIIDETNLSNYLKFEVFYIGEARVNIKLIQK